jgi:gluconolactonase
MTEHPDIPGIARLRPHAPEYSSILEIARLAETEGKHMRMLTEELQFPEGPVVMPDGSVLAVEVRGGTLARISLDGEVTRVADCGGGPNGAAIGPDGSVYVCNNGGFQWSENGGLVIPGEQPESYTGGSIQRVDLAAGEVTTLYTHCGDIQLRGPNDIVFDTSGGFYFTDLGKSRPRELDKGAIFYATTDGSTIREVAFPMDHPNGIGLSPDGHTLYVAESTTARVWAWDIEGEGQLANKRLVVSLPGLQYLDSLAIEAAGNVCLATLLTGAITVVSPEGEIVEVVKVPEPDPMVTNICFGGPDLATAYITSSGRGRLYETTWARPGLKLNY